MKLTKFTQTFKTISAKSDDVVRRGKKRTNLDVMYKMIEASEDVASGSAGISDAHVAFACNEVIEQYAKALIAKNSDDWNFCPAIDDLTLSAAHEWFTTTASKTRAVTAVTLGAFARWYEKQSQLLLGKSQKAAIAGASVIQQKLQPIMGNNDAISAFSKNLVDLAEVIADRADERLISELSEHAAVYDWLVEKLAEVISVDVNDL